VESKTITELICEPHVPINTHFDFVLDMMPHDFMSNINLRQFFQIPADMFLIFLIE